MRRFLAIDIGGTLIKYGVLTEKGEFIEKNETSTEAELGGEKVIDKVKWIGDQLKAKYTLTGVCISTAGQVNSKKGEILYASSLIPYYTGKPVKRELERYFRLPVEVENDVNCVGLAESWKGKGRNAQSLFCLTVGTGIGGSYIIDNKLHTGHSFSGGEIGYIPIEGVQFEELASTRTLIKNVAERKGVSEEEIDGEAIFKHALEEDIICVEEIEKLVYYLSKGIATITYMMNPEMIVIGGGITKQKDYLFPLIKEQLKNDIIPAILNNTKIEIAGNLNDAGMIGALRNFLLQESIQPFNKITTIIESNKHKLSNGERTIAEYIISNMSDVPHNTISDLAEVINVSESMITRFCKKIEVESYSNLRLLAKEAIIGGTIHNKEESNDLVEVKKEYTQMFNKIATLNNTLDFPELINQPTLSGKIILFGVAEMSFLAKLIQYKMMQYGVYIDTFTNNDEIESYMQFLNANDTVIGLSTLGYDDEINNMVETSKGKGCTVIGITSQKGTILSMLSDYCILLPSGENLEEHPNTFSEVSILYLLEVLFKQLAKENKVQIQDKIED